jgi:malonyl-CoA O-methyltransferase
MLQLSSIDAHALWAPSYDNPANPILSLEERVVEPLLPVIEGRDVLDVACGTGRWLERLVRRGAATALGLDLSSEMLCQACKKPELATRLVEADATAIPLGASSVDVAICSFAVSYVADVERLADELSRVVKNGGGLIVADFHPSAQARGWKRSFSHNGKTVEIRSIPRSVARVRETFAERGFEPVVCLEPEFGENEREIFEKCGKGEVFETLRGQAAIFVLMFRRSRGISKSDESCISNPKLESSNRTGQSL